MAVRGDMTGTAALLGAGGHVDLGLRVLRRSGKLAEAAAMAEASGLPRLAHALRLEAGDEREAFRVLDRAGLPAPGAPGASPVLELEAPEPRSEEREVLHTPAPHREDRAAGAGG